MKQKKTTPLVLVLFFLSKILAGNPDMIKNFCLKNNIHQKSVIIALNLSSCVVCYMSPDELLNSIRALNADIPVYVITDEDMAEGEEAIFRSRFGEHSGSIAFITDQLMFRYMLAEKGGVPSVCCVSEEGNVLAFKHLKHEPLNDFFNAVKPGLQVFLINKTELKSKVISPKKYANALFLDSSIYLHHWGVNVIAKYNRRGVNTKNLFIDSLRVDYLQIARVLFPENIYRSSERDYKAKHNKRNRLVRPVNLFQMGKDTLCAIMEILACGDTVLNNKPTVYERSYDCLFLFDADLNYLGAKFFFSRSEACLINSYMKGAYSDHHFYLGKYDEALKQDVMVEFEMKDSTLFLKRQCVIPQKPKEKNGMPITPYIGKSGNAIYLTCYSGADGAIPATDVYKFNTAAGTFSIGVTTDLCLSDMYVTPRNNNIFMTRDKNSLTAVKAYDKNTRQFTDSKEKMGVKNQKTGSLFFVMDGYLHEYAYTE